MMTRVQASDRWPQLVGGCACAAVGGVVLSGYLLDVSWLRAPIPGTTVT
jgi:hypothetical protein